MKQTAVEWLCNEWLYIDQEFDMKLIDKKIYWERLRSVQEQAKQMEKEQMEDSYCFGIFDSEEGGLGFNHYYNKTFKSE